MLSGLAERLFTQRVFYASLFVFFFASIALLVLHALGAETAWSTFYRVYLILALAHTWYVFVLLAWSDLRPRTYPRCANEAITVIMPCYNEDPELLRRAVQSVVRARGVKHIVIVDDGSTNGVHETLHQFAASRHIQLHVLERNQGKRAALHAAITRCVRENPFIVVMDSDTVLDEHALVRVVEPLKERKPGFS